MASASSLESGKIWVAAGGLKSSCGAAGSRPSYRVSLARRATEWSHGFRPHWPFTRRPTAPIIAVMRYIPGMWQAVALYAGAVLGKGVLVLPGIAAENAGRRPFAPGRVSWA